MNQNQKQTERLNQLMDQLAFRMPTPAEKREILVLGGFDQYVVDQLEDGMLDGIAALLCELGPLVGIRFADKAQLVQFMQSALISALAERNMQRLEASLDGMEDVN